MALKFFDSWMFNFNGLLVGGTTWGLSYLLYRDSRGVLNKLLNMIDLVPDETADLLVEFRKTYCWRRIFGYGSIIGILGATSLLLSGYPLEGFAKWYLAVGSASLHFFAGCILVHLYHSIRFFWLIDSKYDNIRIKDDLAPMQLESFNTYFIVTATMGIFASYFAFRGTLTAGFTFPFPMLEKMLIYPVLVYLPVGLMYSFYPRYVLKRIYDRSNIEHIKRLDQVRRNTNLDGTLSLEQKLQIEDTIMGIREKLTGDARQFPILDIKDYPSLFLAILMFIQYIFHEDAVISEFFKRFSH